MKTIVEARDIAPTTTKVEEEVVATDEILCTTNGIWHDARRTSPTYFRPDPTIIPATE